MIYQYKVMCCCERCISDKSMHYSLLTWHFWGDSSVAFRPSTPLVTPPPPPTQHPQPTGVMNGEDFHSSSIFQYRAVRHVQTSMVCYAILCRFLWDIPHRITFRDICVLAWDTPQRGHLHGVATPDPAT